MFTLCFQPDRQPAPADLCLVLNEKNEILLHADKLIPRMSDCHKSDFPNQLLLSQSAVMGVAVCSVFLGTSGSQAVWLAGTPAESADAPFVGTAYLWMPLRAYMAEIDTGMHEFCNRALHLRLWLLRVKKCGSCGASLVWAGNEIALRCSACGEVWYPTISPAMIVAITRNEGRELLLAQPKNRPHNWYSLIAGFCEAGESLEQTVRREVLEEVGLQVKNLRYETSQGWPFSQSMMLGFTAEYESGELSPDPHELETAAWFPVDDLPFTPPPPTIANLLISLVRDRSQNR